MRAKRHSPSQAKTTTTNSLEEVLDKMAPKERALVGNLVNGQAKPETRPVKIRYKPIAWGFPLDETLFSKWFLSFVQMPVMPWDTIITSQSTYLPEARNTVHKDFLAVKNCEWLVMLDSDVCPPPTFLEKLMSSGKKMICGWYVRKVKNVVQPNIYDYGGMKEDGHMSWTMREQPGIGIEKIDGAGAGCWLMHRSVAEALGEEPYDLLRGGEDLDLCLKVHDAGFETWVDWSIHCAHAGVYLY